MSERFPLLSYGIKWASEAIDIINDAIKKANRAASTTEEGVVELATTAETTTGTDAAKATTPAGVKAVIDALKAAANTWTAAQTISAAAAGSLLVVSTDDAGASGATVVLRQQSASPAVNDVPARFLFNGKDSLGNDETYAALSVIITDPTAATEDADLRWFVVTGGALSVQLRMGGGIQVGTPTGGGQGTGTLNVDNNIYKDGTQVITSRQTGWAATTGTELRTNFGDASLSDTSQALRALIVDLKAHGLIGA